MITIPNEISSVSGLHSWLSEQGLYRAYEEGMLLNLRVDTYFKSTSHTHSGQKEFHVKFVDETSLDLVFGWPFRKIPFMILVWDDRLGSFGVDAPEYGCEKHNLAFAQLVANLIERFVFNDNHLPIKLPGDYIKLYLLNEIL